MKATLYFFNPYPAVGGGDTTLIRFANSVNLNKYNIVYITLKKTKKFSKNIKFIALDSSSTFFGFFKIKKLLEAKENEKKIFFSMQYFVNVWSILFLRKIKNLKLFLYEINHPYELNINLGLVDFFKKKIIKLLVKKIYNKADLISANCNELSRDLTQLVKKNVVTIFNPCFFKLYPKKNTNNEFIKVLNIARFEKQKDHMTLLKAIAVSPLKNKIKLTLVGYGSQQKKIFEYIKKFNINCKIFNNETILSKFYLENDLFIMTSIYEGLPTVMIEAASYGLPIISSDFKSGAREILKNGKNGFMFKVGDFKYLSNLISKFNHYPKQFLLKEKLCRKNLLMFSNKKNLVRFNKLLDSLAN